MLSVENVCDAPVPPVTLPSVCPIVLCGTCAAALCAAQTPCAEPGAHSPGALLRLLQEQLGWKQVSFGRRVLCEQHVNFSQLHSKWAPVEFTRSEEAEPERPR